MCITVLIYIFKSFPLLLQSTIILPYRDRPGQLNTFMKYIHPFLQAQNISYHIIVVEQSIKRSFNRAKLFNVGFLEASLYDQDLSCAIFHDIDLLPLDGRNIYACIENQPRHMASNIDVFRYNLPWHYMTGGALAIPASTFRAVNGFSNQFYGESLLLFF